MLIKTLNLNMYSVQLRYVAEEINRPVRVLHNDIVLWKKFVDPRRSENFQSIAESIEKKLKEMEDLKRENIDIKIREHKRLNGLHSVEEKKEKLVLTVEYGSPPSLWGVETLIRMLNLNMYSVQLRYMAENKYRLVRVLYNDVVLWKKQVGNENYKDIAERIDRKVKLKNLKKPKK